MFQACSHNYVWPTPFTFKTILWSSYCFIDGKNWSERSIWHAKSQAQHTPEPTGLIPGLVPWSTLWYCLEAGSGQGLPEPGRSALKSCSYHFPPADHELITQLLNLIFAVCLSHRIIMSCKWAHTWLNVPKRKINESILFQNESILNQNVSSFPDLHYQLDSTDL